MTSVADSLAPEELRALEQAFRLEIEEQQCANNPDTYIESLLGFVSSAYLWDRMWRFGIVVDNDIPRLESLQGFWVDQDSGSRRADYYVPSDYDITIPLVSIDCPPRLL